MYTSGTTGRPKGVMLTHANLAWKNYAHVTEFGFTSSDIGLACGPLYHVGALDLVTTTMIAVGATTIIHRTFDAALVVDEIERSRITTVWMAPAMLRAVLDQPGIEGRDLSSVRVIIAGGEKLPIPYIERLQRVFPAAWLADAYGLTETVSGDTFLDPDGARTKVGSVGRACLYLELEIWGDDDAPVPAGERGEVVLRGPKVFLGYWNDPDATAAAFRGGWFHTGDIGIKDDDGYVYIVDRLKDMIVSGGENIASSEVERVLYEHPAVGRGRRDRSPRRAVGRGARSRSSCSQPGAAATADELIEHCRGQLAKFKVPKDVTFIEALPRNPSGKVLKRELRTVTPSDVDATPCGNSGSTAASRWSRVPAGASGAATPGCSGRGERAWWSTTSAGRRRATVPMPARRDRWPTRSSPPAARRSATRTTCRPNWARCDLIDTALREFGRIDIVVNNAGIVRWGDLPDVELDALQDTLDVHLVGSFNVTRAAWPHLMTQEYGRVVMTTSTGMFGLRGNLAYAAAKAGVVGLMRNMKLSGRRYNITVNAVAPVAATRMGGAEEDDAEPPADMAPELVAPLVAYLCHEDCPVSGEIYAAGGGRFSRIFIATTEGYVPSGDPTPEDVAANWAAINDEAGYSVPADLPDWAAKYMKHLPS